MKTNNSATPLFSPPLSDRKARPGGRAGIPQGPLFGFLGVLAFSFTLPFTRVAVEDLDPLLVGGGRAVIAALLAAAVLLAARAPRPNTSQWWRLAIVATGVVAGFPLLTSFALQTVPASHGAVVIGLLPAATAVAAVLRAGERPSARFWVASLAGASAAVGFVLLDAGGFSGLGAGDLLLLGAVVLAAFGYAEGGLLARELGAWQTICWALVLALPAMLIPTGMGLSAGFPDASPAAWLAFGYLAVISMFLGFFAWYRGLGIGPISAISQIQLVQPFLTLAWAALLLGEAFTLANGIGAVVIVVCAGAAVRSRVTRRA
ncbi:DMT family transporter [Arthrobacter sp. Helios]|uniref:DMT family transporter n=1 Tax=Arthrobacter sp. Helios TaxID=2828862 RepID=UPI00206D8937|nr:DMT family transporter [Arthrobacter sp. Helios]UPO77158.1 DMT family transporter [Arthrobacter sp. Helios]